MALGGLGGGVLATLRYHITADPDVERGMAAAEARAAAMTKSIDRMKGTVEIVGDMKDLEADLIRANAEVEALTAKKHKLEIEWKTKGDARAFQELQKVNNELEDQNKLIDQNTKALIDRGKAVRTREKELSIAEQLLDREQARGVAIAKMKEQYAKLYTLLQKQNKLDKGFAPSPRELIMMQRTRAELVKLGTELKRRGVDVNELNVNLDQSRSRLRQMASGLANVRLHLGFFSATLKQAFVGLVALGPLLFALIGGVAALAGVLGTGLAGALAVGTAGLTGFALAATGIGLAIGPAVDIAKQKFTALKEAFQGRTGGTREAFLQGVTDSVRTLKELMPQLATETNKTAQVAQRGWSNWMESLRSDDAKGIFEDIMGNFRTALPSIMNGLGSIGALLGRIAQSASKFLPSLSKGFSDWANSLQESIGSGRQLDDRIGRLVGHMREVGHFAQASGGLLAAFFSGGADTGANMMRSMTKTFREWTREIKGGSLDSFFGDSERILSQLIPALGHFSQILFEIGEFAAPGLELAAGALRAILQALNAIVPAPLLQLAAAAVILQKAFSFLLGGTVAGALGKGLLAGLGRLIPSIGRIAPAAIGSQLAIEGLSTSAAAATPALGGMGIALGLAGVAGLGFGIALAKGLSSIPDTISLEDALSRAASRLSAANNAAAAATRNARSAQQTYNRAMADGKISVGNLATAIRNHRLAEDRAAAAAREQAEARRQAKESMQQYRQAVRGVAEAERAQANGVRDRFGLMAAAKKNLDDAFFSMVNTRRALKDMTQLGPQVSNLFNTLRKTVGSKLALKVGLQGNRQAATEIANLANRVTRLGGRKAVVNVLANTDNPRLQLRLLAGMMDNIDKKKPTVKVFGSSTLGSVFTSLKRVTDEGGKAEKPRRVRVTESGAAAAAGRVRTLGSAISALQDKTVTVTTTYKTIGSPPGGRVGNYMGGPAAKGPISAFAVGGAADSAEKRQTKDARRGAVVNKPTFLTGEERKTEWVIAENPMYRRANERFLASAADAFGLALIPAFAGGGPTAGAARKVPKPGKSSNSTAYYQNLKHKISLWGMEYDLDRRDYDRGVFTGGGSYGANSTLGGGQGSSLAALLFDLQEQINLYGLLDKEIGRLLGLQPRKALTKKQKKKLREARKRSRKKGLSKEEKKEARLEVRQWEKRQRAIQSFNQDLAADKQGLAEERKEIPFLIRGLKIDQEELKSGSSSADAAQQLSFTQAVNQARLSFGSNLIGPPGMSSAFSTGPMLAPPAPVPPISATPPPPSLAPLSAPASAGTTTTSSGGVTQNFTFYEPPPDPHTWAQQAGWEAGVG